MEGGLLGDIDTNLIIILGSSDEFIFFKKNIVVDLLEFFQI